MVPALPYFSILLGLVGVQRTIDPRCIETISLMNVERSTSEVSQIDPTINLSDPIRSGYLRRERIDAEKRR